MRRWALGVTCVCGAGGRSFATFTMMKPRLALLSTLHRGLCLSYVGRQGTTLRPDGHPSEFVQLANTVVKIQGYQWEPTGFPS
jgi:hypothetical protein